MTKNILVTDSNGKVIGATYPNRAKGLIKSGRAAGVDESTIRLVSSAVSGAFSDAEHNMEDNSMAKVIDFKARGFKLVAECESNKGTRLMVTENGESVECFEVAEGGALTEIARVAELEKDTDYVFRFMIKSRYVRAEAAESLVSIYFDEEGDGYTYPLDRDSKNRFKASVCKKTEDGLLRVYELPFNSGDAEKCTIRFTVHDMTAWIYPAQNAEAYAALEDVDYDEWRQDVVHQVAKKLNELGDSLGKGLNGFGEFVGEVGGKISKAVNEAINSKSAAKADDIVNAEEAADAEDIGAADAAEAPGAAEEKKAEEGSGIVINGPEEKKDE